MFRGSLPAAVLRSRISRPVPTRRRRVTG